MLAGNWTDTLRSGARPCAPLDGPTDPFGRLDCLLLPLLITSNMSPCDCALSTRTNRRLSDQVDQLWGGDASSKSLKSFRAPANNPTSLCGGGLAVGWRASNTLGWGPSSTQPLCPGELNPTGSPSFVDVSPKSALEFGPASRTAKPLLRAVNRSSQVPTPF